jgi:NAD-dependent DNA ligase
MSKHAGPTGNARNAVSGAVNAKSPDPDVVGLIDFVAYELVSPAPSSLGSGLRWLRKSGFSVVHSKLLSLGDLPVESLA